MSSSNFYTLNEKIIKFNSPNPEYLHFCFVEEFTAEVFLYRTRFYFALVPCLLPDPSLM